MHLPRDEGCWRGPESAPERGRKGSPKSTARALDVARGRNDGGTRAVDGDTYARTGVKRSEAGVVIRNPPRAGFAAAEAPGVNQIGVGDGSHARDVGDQIGLLVMLGAGSRREQKKRKNKNSKKLPELARPHDRISLQNKISQQNTSQVFAGTLRLAGLEQSIATLLPGKGFGKSTFCEMRTGNLRGSALGGLQKTFKKWEQKTSGYESLDILLGQSSIF